jgi:hypothetical protein
MASNGASRRGLLLANGILSILAAIFQINNGAMLVAFFFLTGLTHTLAWEVLPFLPGLWFDFWQIPIPAMVGWRPSIEVFIRGLSLLILGILAMAGGISAVRRKSFGLSMAGAICALASGLLGVLAVIFVALGKREFGAERKENGI